MTTLLRIGLFAATLGLAPSTQAFVLSGSFSGVAEASALPLNFTPALPTSYFDGAAVTGTFQLDLPDTFATGASSFQSAQGWMEIDYVIKAVHFHYYSDFATNGPVTGFLDYPSNPPGQQSVTFQTGPIPKYQGASFTLGGPVGSLFDGDDASTLHLAPASSPTFGTGFDNTQWELDVNVQVTQSSIVAALTPPAVPEPGAPTLILAGMAVLSCRWTGLAWRGRSELRRPR